MAQCAHCGLAISLSPHHGTFLFARHGETKLNKKNRVVGSIDDLLTREGQRQARTLALSLKIKYAPIHLIVSSPLRRARETAYICGAHLDVETIIEPNLRERGVGVHEGKKLAKEIWPLFFSRDYTPENGESYTSFEKRIRTFLLSYTQAANLEKNILFSTHALVSLMVIKCVKELQEEEIIDYPLPDNASIICFLVQNQTCS
ncbi:MAG: putative phosphoglycerate mutase, partial [Parcubacteria group bacterium Gr01-1014_33]